MKKKTKPHKCWKKAVALLLVACLLDLRKVYFQVLVILQRYFMEEVSFRTNLVTLLIL